MHSVRSTNRILLATSLAASLFIAANTVDDLTWTSQQDRCSIALPNARWTEKEPFDPKVAWFAANSDGMKVVYLTVFDIHGISELNRSIFEDAYLKAANAKKLKGYDFAIEGRTAFRLVAESLRNGKSLSHVVVVVVSHGKAYRIAAQSATSDADTDPEINTSINSFHLFDPPEPQTNKNRALPAKDDLGDSGQHERRRLLLASADRRSHRAFC